MKSRVTKATEIPKAVKLKVYDRDHGCCIICGHAGLPEAHYISRAQLGLGIEENIFTACRKCHREYDGNKRDILKPVIADYLKSCYPDWDESKLTYRKWET